MAKVNGNFIEFEDVNKLFRFLRKKNSEPPVGSIERKKYESIFESSIEKDCAVGILRTLCPCGTLSDGGRIITIKRGSEDYRNYTETRDTPVMFCNSCLQLSQALVVFGKITDEKKLKNVMSYIWRVKREILEGSSGTVE